MKKYKILKVNDGILKSPGKFQGYTYGKKKDVIGKKLTCSDFDTSNETCSRGYYATDIEGLIYTNLSNPNYKVFEVEVSGKEKIFDEYKQRFEHMTIIRQLSVKELKQLVKVQSDKMDWDYYHALFPYNPLQKTRKKVTKKEIELLKKWASVRASVGSSVWDPVRDSVWTSVGDSWASVGRDSVWASVEDSVWTDSVWGSVWASVWDSVKDSVGAYISSLFPNIKQWKYITHENGKNPFQPCIDLWNKNLVPSYGGKTWRLHTGPKAKIIWEES
jgi:hypothetical protein